MNEKLKYAIIFAFIVNSIFIFSNFQDRTYDSYEHIFFADHYRKSWFDTWETKWYGGFSVTSYPPLAHQLIALLSFAFGLEWAYKILTFSILTIFPLAVNKFSKIFVSDRAANNAAILSVILPSILQAAYLWGQFTTIFGLIAGLFTIIYLDKFLSSGRWLFLSISFCLLGISVSSHHFTAVFLIPTLVVILFVQHALERKQIKLKIIKTGNRLS